MAARARVTLVLLLAAGACEAPPPEETKQAETVTLFKPYATYPVGSYAQGVAIGDLNGDGRNDVAVTTTYYFDPANDQMLHVFLQAPDGTLLPRVRYPLGRTPQSIDIGDVNGDGRADVVVGNFDSASIGVLLQNAGGTLDPMVAYPTVNSLSVKIGDFNSDGRLDVVGINWGSRGDGVDVFLQTAAGTLAPPVTYHVPHGGYDEVDVGDVNGDGRTDIVVMSGQLYADPNVSVLVQLADGTMSGPVSYSVGPSLLTHGVAVGDVNGDGKQDVVVSYGGNRPSSFIGTFLQNGAGTLDPAISLSSYDIPEPVVLADVDGDRRLDVLVAHGGWNQLGVYRQRGGALAAEELYPIPYASQYQPQGLAAGDINGDGLTDAVLADYNNGLVVLLHVDDAPPTVALAAPLAGSYFAGLPLTISWSASDNVAVTGLDVTVSADGGASYAPVPGCTGLLPTATSCVWASPGPISADVRLRVTARDAAGNQGTAAVDIALVAAAVTVTAPAGGESWFIGTTQTIRWTSNLPPTETVRVELTRDGTSYESLAAAAPVNGSIGWTVTGPATTAAHVRVTWNRGPASGVSSAFAIVAPSVSVTAPVAGAAWLIGTSQSFGWTANIPPSESVTIELSRDGGASYQVLSSAAPNTGSYAWSVTGPATSSARVRIGWAGLVSGTSDLFALVAPSVSVTAPAAGAAWTIGTSRVFTWTSNIPSESVTIELSRDGGATYQVLSSAAPNSGSFPWTVSGPATSGARVRIGWGGLGSGTSDPFTLVAPSVTVTAPNTSVSWSSGTNHAISWTHNLGLGATFTISVSRDGGGSWSVITASAPAGATTGNYTWAVTGPHTHAARIRVSWNGTPAAQDQSNVNFTIK